MKTTKIARQKCSKYGWSTHCKAVANQVMNWFQRKSIIKQYRAHTQAKIQVKTSTKNTKTRTKTAMEQW